MANNFDEVVLVDERDEVLGTMDKLKAHKEGALHRAFSVFLFDHDGRLLLQRRAETKYHSGGLWTNSCCSHPRMGEDLLAAAERRVAEELGIITPLQHRFSFIYRASFENGLHEHELDHVFFGHWSGSVRPDPEEVIDWRYATMEEIDADLREHPQRFTIWLKACWPEVLADLHATRSHLPR
ncbi:MAG: isopentenyl-diphosphate Delta-isomerase [Flavobacteriales bacterium]|nr:isopentenyl-diphosphate Delta-isomerase [Flavobacteriales bacterium]